MLYLSFIIMFVPFAILFVLYLVCSPSTFIFNTVLPSSFLSIVDSFILNTSSEFAIAMFVISTFSTYSGKVTLNSGFLYKSFSILLLFNLMSNSMSLFSAIVLSVFLDIVNSAFVSGFSKSILTSAFPILFFYTLA